MKVKMRLLALLLVCALLLPATVLAVPALPLTFSGAVTIESVNAPVGTIVTAEILGTEVATNAPTGITVAGQWGLSAIPYDPGKTITFKVNGEIGGTYVMVAEGAVVVLNLDVSDTTAPTVVDESPTGRNVDVDTVVTATFSEPMDEATIDDSSFTVTGSSVAGSVSYNASSLTATFTPDEDLDYDHRYTVNLSTGITDTIGNPLTGNRSWTFTTFTPEWPYLEVDKEASPSTIGQMDSGILPEGSTITLTVRGAGEASEIAALDVVFSLDASGSMGSGVGSRMEYAKDGANAFIDNMNPARDQAGAVSWTSSVLNSWALTDDFDAMKANIGTITASGGTNLEAGLAGAVAIMDAGKQPGSARCIIFLSDGSGSYTGTATADAASKGYVIYSLGVGSGVNEAHMQDMANQTGGSYHNALNAEDIEDVFDEIAAEISGVAGTNVMVTDVLPSYMVLDDNFTIEPDDITENADGTTTLEWYLGVVAIDEEWTVSFDVSSERCGRVLANVFDESMVTYNPVVNFGGGFTSTEGAEEVLFPKTYLNVRCPEDEYCPEVSEGPAQMSIQNIYADPEQITQNMQVEVWVSVGNSGDTKGTKSVALYVNGVFESSQTVSVGPGGGQNVLFLVNRIVPGTYTVSVEGREAQFTVLGMGPPQAAPAPPMAVAGWGGGLGTGGIIAIIVIIIAIGVGLMVILRREST